MRSSCDAVRSGYPPGISGVATVAVSAFARSTLTGVLSRLLIPLPPSFGRFRFLADARSEAVGRGRRREDVALPRLTFGSTQRGWPAGMQSSDVTECIDGEEVALHAVT